MKRQIWSRFWFVVGIAILAGVIAAPPTIFGENAFSKKLETLKITLGLDLAGGTELDYRVDLSEAIAQNSDDDPSNDVNLNSIAESVRDALESRVNPAGVGEIIVKRSPINGEEHILIQMPPSSNVEKAKRDAERDNRLEFFEENPALLKTTREFISSKIEGMTAENFDSEAEKLANDKKIFRFDFPAKFRGEIADSALAEKLFSAKENSILPEIVETRTELEYKIGDDGKLEIKSYPRELLAIVRVGERIEEEREIEIPEKARARHILFGYTGAMRAGDDVKYSDSEEARAKAEEILEKLKNEGVDNFEDLAKEFSTESVAKSTGGDLGEFSPGKMVPAFDEAIFGEGSEVGLVPELVETDFGFHVIEILEKTEARTESKMEPKVSYSLLGWDKNEIIWIPTELGGKQLENAVVGYDQIGQPVVNLLFDSEGADLFAKLTGNVAARRCDGGPCRLGIKVGGEWITTPTVREKIIGRQSQISGNFTFESAKDLADGLNLGAIDAPVILSGQITIQPELGADQLAKSLRASMWGFVAIAIFMLAVYRLSGVVAVISLILYAGIFISILKIWPESFGGPIVLSLAGVAGIALSIGLAVDGNILIFERFREEIRRGKNLTHALDLGFERAWSAIRDSNLTTLLTCFILFTLGSSVVKGFAITLIVGTLISMFTAVTISRNLLRFLLLFEPLRKNHFFVAGKNFFK